MTCSIVLGDQQKERKKEEENNYSGHNERQPEWPNILPIGLKIFTMFCAEAQKCNL